MKNQFNLKRTVSSAAFSSDTDLICIVHYDRATDNEIRPLSSSQFDTIVEAAEVRGQQAAEGHRLDAICDSIPAEFNQSIHGAHRWCYKNFTNVSRLRGRSVTPVPSSTDLQARTSSRTSAGGTATSIFPQNECIFCGTHKRYKKGTKTAEILVKCVTEIAEKTIKDCAKRKNDFKLLGIIDQVDLIAKEARYHETCRRDYIRKEERRHHSDDEASTSAVSEQVAAYDDAFRWLSEHIQQDIIKCGKVERMSMLRDRFLHYMENCHPDFFNPLYTAQKLKARLSSHFGSRLTFWLPQQRCKSELVFSSDLDIGEAVEAAFAVSSSDEYVLDKAASILQRDVKDSFASSCSQPWPPTATSLKSVSAPQSLTSFLLRLISGKTVQNASAKDVRISQSIAEDLCSAVTRSRWSMPKHVLLGMSLRHLTGSAEVVLIINRYGHCHSYSKLLELETALAYQAELSDTVLPPNISTEHNVVTHLCFDNFDLLEETTSGAGTTHSTHGIVIQELTHGAEPLYCAVEVEKSGKRKFVYSTPPMTDVHIPGNVEPPAISESLTECESSVNTVLKHGAVLWSICHALYNTASSVPDWTGWLSVTAFEKPAQMSNIGYMKPIMHPITQHSTVQQCLHMATDVSRRVQQNHTFVTFDLAAAKLALSIVWHKPQQYCDVTVHLGAFHTLCSFMGALGKMMMGSGFEEVVIQSGICASGSLDQVMSGKHFNRALRIHQQMLAAVERLLLNVFVDRHHVDTSLFPELSDLAEHPEACKVSIASDSAAVQRLLIEHAGFLEEVRKGDLGKTAQFWVQYRDCVWTMLTFVQAFKTNDVQLYIKSLRQLCPLLFAADRLNYARYLPMYHAMLTNLPSSANAMLESNGLSVARSLVPGCRIPIDMAIEQTINRSAKTVGGIVGFSRNVNAYSRWCLTRHKKAEYLEALREDLGFTTAQTILHASAHSTNCQHFARDVQQVVDAFANFVNPFALHTLEESQLYCVSSGCPATKEVEEALLNYTTKGEEAAADFIHTRLNNKTVDFHAPMKKMKLKTFADMAVTKKIPTSKQKTVTVRAERNLLGQLLILSQSHNISFEKLFKYSLSPIPWSLATADGTLAKTQKAQLMHILESECQQEVPIIDFEKSVFVIDGNALIRAITNLPKTFGELS